MERPLPGGLALRCQSLLSALLASLWFAYRRFSSVGAWCSRVSALALGNDTYTHIPLIPLVSACLIYTNRKVIFSRSSEVWKLGGALLSAGVLAIAVAQSNVVHLQDANQLSLAMLGVVLVWTGAFGFFFGRAAFRAAIFPLLFLLFMVPIPEPFLSK